jgi:diguanylate cyclase (GGDEF)-like protein
VSDPRTAETGEYDALYKSYVHLTKEVENLSTIREIALAIGTSIELSEILPTIATVVQGALGVRKLTLYEWDKRASIGKPLVAQHGRDLITMDRLAEDQIEIEGSTFGGVLTGGAPVIANSEYECDAYIPLISKTDTLGVMHLQDRDDGAPFALEDTALYQTIGGMIAIAINNAQLYALAVTDGLTGLYVRRYFDLRMEEEMEQAKRYGRDFALMLFDIDHFKKFNDTHGHQTGDLVLQQFADLLRNNTRKSDICCRYGGEEMTVILPESAMEEAALLSNKLCDIIRNHVFKGTGGQDLTVTTSIGVSAYREDFDDPHAMVEAADQALYKAKELGRNRVELDSY